MKNYTIKINNGNIEQEFEFRMSIYKDYRWELFLTNVNLNDLEVTKVKSPYSIQLMENSDWISYDLYKNDEPIKSFEWEDGSLGYTHNLLEVINYIMKDFGALHSKIMKDSK